MKKTLIIISIASSLLLMEGCTSKKLLDDRTSRDVQMRLEQRASWLPQYKTDEMTSEEKDAMDFLYAWLPLADVADFPSELFYDNVKASFKARNELNWNVPDDLFLHFVLPVRANNENLDCSRSSFYEELKPRVKDLPMEEAILEVNHWCHEKAVYTSDDARTLSPSAMVLTAMGRCGEESTFCVAALRSVGIPARQIYTPRWAHTDDNHAWVEAWANGKWYYIGACEPDAKPNHGWFDAPAKRGLIMCTKVFGIYYTDDEILGTSDGYTEINVTENYAPVKRHYCKVVDKSNNPVEDADVSYTIFNYAEYYPAVKKKSDKEGMTSLVSGLGDMLIWAVKDGKYGFAKIDPRIQDTAVVVLEKTDCDLFSYDVDLVPPVSLPVENNITKEESRLNSIRMAKEDSIRNAYIATFMKEEDARKLAEECGTDPDKTWSFIKNSRGNWKVISEFLRSAQDKEKAMALLENISVKDLKDTPLDVLNDHLLDNCKDTGEMYKKYVLSPRIDNELITAYRSSFKKLHGGSMEKIQEIISSIKLTPELNPTNIRMTPEGVVRIKMGDKQAIERAAIALMRSADIPSRREPISEKPQYWDGNGWKYIEFPQLAEVSEKAEGNGNVKVTYDKGSGAISDPRYYIHFSFAKISNGVPRLVDVAHSNTVDMGDDGTTKVLDKNIPMPTGTYQLVSGTRLADGTILSHVDIFSVKDGETKNLKLKLREKQSKLQVIGNIDVESLYVAEGSDKETSLLSTAGRGYFIMALIDSKKEPTNHMLRAFEAVNGQLEKWGRKIILVLHDKESMDKFKKEEFPHLPSTICYGYDYNGKTTQMVKEMLKADVDRLPVLIVSDSFGKVVYTSTGYNTSTSEQIKSILSQLEKQ